MTIFESNLRFGKPVAGAHILREEIDNVLGASEADDYNQEQLFQRGDQLEDAEVESRPKYIELHLYTYESDFERVDYDDVTDKRKVDGVKDAIEYLMSHMVEPDMNLANSSSRAADILRDSGKFGEDEQNCVWATEIVSEPDLKQCVYVKLIGFTDEELNEINYVVGGDAEYFDGADGFEGVGESVSPIRIVLNRSRNEFGEYEVRVYNGRDVDTDKTYYTDDFEDAVGTMKMMADDLGLSVKEVSPRKFIAESFTPKHNKRLRSKSRNIMIFDDEANAWAPEHMNSRFTRMRDARDYIDSLQTKEPTSEYEEDDGVPPEVVELYKKQGGFYVGDDDDKIELCYNAGFTMKQNADGDVVHVVEWERR